jgi:hypothetical protein
MGLEPTTFCMANRKILPTRCARLCEREARLTLLSAMAVMLEPA